MELNPGWAESAGILQRPFYEVIALGLMAGDGVVGEVVVSGRGLSEGPRALKSSDMGRRLITHQLDEARKLAQATADVRVDVREDEGDHFSVGLGEFPNAEVI